MRPGVILASRTPREVGTCLVGKSFPALLPASWDAACTKCAFALLPAPICWQGHAHAAAGRWKLACIWS